MHSQVPICAHICIMCTLLLCRFGIFSACSLWHQQNGERRRLGVPQTHTARAHPAANDNTNPPTTHITAAGVVQYLSETMCQETMTNLENVEWAVPLLHIDILQVNITICMLSKLNKIEPLCIVATTSKQAPAKGQLIQWLAVCHALH